MRIDRYTVSATLGVAEKLFLIHEQNTCRAVATSVLDSDAILVCEALNKHDKRTKRLATTSARKDRKEKERAFKAAQIDAFSDDQEASR